MKGITVGTRVAFSRQWLRSTATFTGWRAFGHGTVEAVENGIATVRWDDRTRIAGEPAPASSRVLAANLVREDRIHLEPV
jgi:hypothetical protein